MHKGKLIAIIVIIIIALFAQASVIAQPAMQEQESGKWLDRQKLTKARITFDRTSFDFGYISKGAVVTHKFGFTNTGSDTLIVTKIKPTCGCTSTQEAGFKVPPGGRSSIDIVFDSGRFNGRVIKSINIECNDSLNPYLEIRFKASIGQSPVLTCTPSAVDFKDIKKGASGRIAIELSNNDTTASKLIIVEKPDPDFIKTTVGKQHTVIEPKGSLKITFTLADTAKPGPFRDALTLEAENKPGSRITIPIAGNILERQ